MGHTRLLLEEYGEVIAPIAIKILSVIESILKIAQPVIPQVEVIAPILSHVPAIGIPIAYVNQQVTQVI